MNKTSYYFIQASIVCCMIVTFHIFTYPKLFQSYSISKYIVSNQDLQSSLFESSDNEMWAALEDYVAHEKFKTQRDSFSFQNPVSIFPKYKKESLSQRNQSSYFTLESISKFLNFTSNLVGTIFPVVGFIMTVILWKNQKKSH